MKQVAFDGLQSFTGIIDEELKRLCSIFGIPVLRDKQHSKMVPLWGAALLSIYALTRENFSSLQMIHMVMHFKGDITQYVSDDLGDSMSLMILNNRYAFLSTPDTDIVDMKTSEIHPVTKLDELVKDPIIATTINVAGIVRSVA